MAGPWLCRRVRPVASGLIGSAAADRSPRLGRAVPVEDIERILIIRPGGLGDAVLTFPMVQALKTFYPQGAVDVLAETRNAHIYTINPFINTIHAYDKNPVTTLRRLRRTGYDLVIDTEQFHHLSALIANALRPKYLCGFDTCCHGKFQTHRVSYDDHTYEALSFLSLVEALVDQPVAFDPNKSFVHLSDDLTKWAKAKLGFLHQRPVATISPGASAAYRLWPAERYAAVIRWLAGQGFFTVILGGKDTAEYAGKITIGLSGDDVRNLSGCTTLARAAAVIQQGQIHVSADTGILHLAYGLATPTVALFGPGNYEKWAPPGRQHVIVRKPVSCSPCTRMGHTPKCPYRVACMASIRVDDVTRAIKKVLAP